MLLKGQGMSIHPTAIIDPTAQLGDDIEVGPYAIIEGDTVIGNGCVIRPHAVIRRYTIMGDRNFVDSGVVIAGDPQDLKFDRDMVSYVRIGNDNTFKEYVTINRATVDGGATVVGDNNYWMCYGHAGHDVTVCNNVIVAPNCQIGGHSTIHDGAILPANGNIHQFCWIGRKVMFQGGAQTSMHLPPYVIVADVNNVVGLNAVGLKRDPNISAEDITQIKEAFSITYRQGHNKAEVLHRLDACKDWGDAADEFRQFVHKVTQAQRPYNRGLCPKLSRISGRRG